MKYKNDMERIIIQISEKDKHLALFFKGKSWKRGGEEMGMRGDCNEVTEAYYTGLMASVGYRKGDIEKPVIGIVNSYN